MPIYEYRCSACGHLTDIVHGVNDPGPHFCPECGAEGTMRKTFAAPAIHFKGSGWAKKERRSSPAAKGGASKPEASDAPSDAAKAPSESTGAASPSAGDASSD